MYFAVIEASPKPGAEAFSKYQGAHVACWINTVDIKEGRKRAVALVDVNGWFAKSVFDEKLISIEDCPSKEGGLQYYQQALVDGEVCVIYTFPHPTSSTTN